MSGRPASWVVLIVILGGCAGSTGGYASDTEPSPWDASIQDVPSFLDSGPEEGPVRDVPPGEDLASADPVEEGLYFEVMDWGTDSSSTQDEAIEAPETTSPTDPGHPNDPQCAIWTCEDTECRWVPKDGWCLIDDACIADRTPSPDNPCLGCRSDVAGGGWSPLEEQACDDGDACTDSDACVVGQCKGRSVTCDDGDFCTTDRCDEGCVHEPILENEGCYLSIELVAPPRGEMRSGDPGVEVSGRVAGPRAVSSIVLTFNQDSVSLPVDPLVGTFQRSFEARHGLNVVRAEVQDSDGRRARTVRSFLWSREWIPPTGSDGGPAWISDGLGIFLGQDALDDRDPSDLDDLATLAARLLPVVDLVSFAPRPAASATVDACTYDAFLDSLSMDSSRLLITPRERVLDIRGLLDTVSGRGTLAAKGSGCSDLTANVTASSLQAMMTLSAIREGDGPVTTDVPSCGTWVSDDFNLSPCEPLCNAITPLRWVLEGTLEDTLAEKVPKTLNEQFSRAFQQNLTVPELLPGSGPVELSLHARVRDVGVRPSGVEILLDGAVGGPLSDPSGPGSLGPSPCQLDILPSLEGAAGLRAGVVDTIVHRLSWALWQAGALHFDVDRATMVAAGVDPETYGVTDLTLTLEARLPPVVDSCGPQGLPMVLQVGELSVSGSMTLFGTPLSLDTTLHLDLPVSLEPRALDVPSSVTVLVHRPTRIEADVLGYASEDPTMTPSFLQEFLDSILDAAAKKLDGMSTTLDLPSVDLAAYVPQILSPARIELSLGAFDHDQGVTTGSVFIRGVEPFGRPSSR